MLRLLGALLLTALLGAQLAAPWAAAAQPSAASDAEEPPPEQEQPPRREVPDYDGRPTPRPSARQIAAWVPRVLLFPIYLAFEYLLRRPLGSASRMAEEGAPSDPLELITFGPDDQMMLAPTFVIDFGQQPSVGLHYRWNEALHPMNQIRAHFGTWGPDWLSGVVADRIVDPGENWELELRAEAERRPDGLYYGSGSQAGDVESYYQHRKLDAEMSFEGEPYRNSLVYVFAGVTNWGFGDDVCCGASTVERVLEGRLPELPARFEDGYTMLHYGLEAILDSRPNRPAPGSGAMVRGYVEHGFDLVDRDRGSWLRYGFSVGGHVDLSGHSQVLSLTASAELIETLEGEIPFTELVDISGRQAMRGFRTGQLVGESAATLVLQYSWPLWIFLDAVAHVAVGNVFGPRLEDFEAADLRMSFGVALAVVRSLEHAFDLTVAWGTDRFGDGGDVQQWRLSLGATRNF